MIKTISVRQTAIIISILLFANKILVLPSLLYEVSKADGFFIILFLLSLEFLILLMFLRLKSLYPSTSFYDILKLKLGTFLAKFFYILLAIYFFYKIMLLFNICYMYFHVQVYIDASYYIFIFAFLVIINSSVLRGIRPIARSIEFFYGFILFCLIFCIALSIANFDKFPIFFDSKLVNFFDGSFRHLFCFGDMLILLVLIDKVDSNNLLKSKSILYFFTSAVIILSVYFMFYSIFDYTAFLHKNAISDIITFSYRFIDLGRLDIIAVIIIMFLAFFQLCLYAYAFIECFIKIFSKLSVVYSMVVYDLLFIFIVFTSLIDYLVAIKIGVSIIPYLSIFLYFLLPLFCIFVKKRGGR